MPAEPERLLRAHPHHPQVGARYSAGGESPRWKLSWWLSCLRATRSHLWSWRSFLANWGTCGQIYFCFYEGKTMLESRASTYAWKMKISFYSFARFNLPESKLRSGKNVQRKSNFRNAASGNPNSINNWWPATLYSIPTPSICVFVDSSKI